MTEPYRAAGSFTGESYVERAADRAIIREIELNTRYPYLLAPRQSGKSSLIARTISVLKERNVSCRFVDLQGLPTSGDYRTFLSAFSFSLLPTPPSEVPGELREVLFSLLESETGRLVIFVDEIDALLDAPFKDEFFGLIRSFYNLRAIEPMSGFGRIQFVLSGAAQPSQLISSANHSPFNVGVPIVLDDLSTEEVEKMLAPLRRRASVDSESSKRISYHTSGSVYLTQRILENLWHSEEVRKLGRVSVELIDATADDIAQKCSTDVHFLNIHRAISETRFASRAFSKLVGARRIALAERQYLEMTGVTRKGRVLRNRIYDNVFLGAGPLALAPAKSAVAPRNSLMASLGRLNMMLELLSGFVYILIWYSKYEMRRLRDLSGSLLLTVIGTALVTGFELPEAPLIRVLTPHNLPPKIITDVLRMTLLLAVMSLILERLRQRKLMDRLSKITTSFRKLLEEGILEEDGDRAVQKVLDALVVGLEYRSNNPFQAVLLGRSEDSTLQILVQDSHGVFDSEPALDLRIFLSWRDAEDGSLLYVPITRFRHGSRFNKDWEFTWSNHPQVELAQNAFYALGPFPKGAFGSIACMHVTDSDRPNGKVLCLISRRRDAMGRMEFEAARMACTLVSQILRNPRTRSAPAAPPNS